MQKRSVVLPMLLVLSLALTHPRGALYATEQIPENTSPEASEHGSGILKKIDNRTTCPVTISFAHSTFPPIAAGGSTDDFPQNNAVTAQDIAAWAETLTLGIGILALANGADKLPSVGARPQGEDEAPAKNSLQAVKEAIRNKDAEDQQFINDYKQGKVPAMALDENSSEADRALQKRADAARDLEVTTQKSRDEVLKKAQALRDDKTLTDAERKTRGAEIFKQEAEIKKLYAQQDAKALEKPRTGIIGGFKNEIDSIKNEFSRTNEYMSREKSTLDVMSGKISQETYAKQQELARNRGSMTASEIKAAEKDIETSKKDPNGTKKSMSLKEMMANANKQKKAITAAAKDRKDSDKGNTEKLTKAAKFAKISTVLLTAGALSSMLIAKRMSNDPSVSAIIDSILPYEVPDGKFRLPVDKNPIVSGVGRDETTNFTEDSIVKISKLLGVGCTWFMPRVPLGKPCNFTMRFLVRVQDKGNAQIWLGKESGTTPLTRIILGAYDNTSTTIVDGTQMVAQVNASDHPCAVVQPGKFVPYWISCDHGFFMVGYGQPGYNVLASWQDPSFDPDTDRLGISCDVSSVEFAEIDLAPPVKTKITNKKYTQRTDPIAISTQTIWVTEQTREVGRGAYTFEYDGTGPLHIFFSTEAQADAHHVTVPVGSAYEEDVRLITPNDQGNVDQRPITKIGDNQSTGNVYWASFADNQCLVGRGALGEGLLFALNMPTLPPITSLGFATDDQGSVQVKNLAVYPPVELDEQQTAGYVERRKISGRLISLYPFSYQVRQSGQAIEARDAVSGQSWFVAKTPQQHADYFFDMIINPLGETTFSETGNPKNFTKFLASAGAMTLQEGAGILFAQGSQLGNDEIEVGDPFVLEPLLLSQTLTSIGITSLGIGPYIAGSVANEEIKYGFRDHNSYVYTEKVKFDKKTTTSMPPEVAATKKILDNVVADIKKFDQNDVAVFDYYFSAVKQGINLLNHPSLSAQYKNILQLSAGSSYQRFKGLYTQAKTRQEEIIMEGQVLQMLVDGLHNRYLFDDRSDADRRLMAVWQGWVQDLAGRVLARSATTQLSMQPLFGQYLWLTSQPIENPQSWSIFIQAQGINDIFIGAAPDTTPVRDTEIDIYEAVIGGNNNEATFLRVKSLGHSVASVQKKDIPDAGLAPGFPEKMWLSFYHGVVSIGRGEWGQGKLIEWHDPYPLNNLKVAGISTWNSPVTFQQVLVGPAVQDLTPALVTQIKERLNKTATDAQQKLAAKDALSKQFDDLAKAEKDPLVYDVLAQKDFEENDPLTYNNLDYDPLESDKLSLDQWQYGFGDGQQPPDDSQNTDNAQQAKNAPAAAAPEEDAKPQKKSDAINAMAARGSIGAVMQEAQQFKGFSKKQSAADKAAVAAKIKELRNKDPKLSQKAAAKKVEDARQAKILADLEEERQASRAAAYQPPPQAQTSASTPTPAAPAVPGGLVQQSLGDVGSTLLPTASQTPAAPAQSQPSTPAPAVQSDTPSSSAASG